MSKDQSGLLGWFGKRKEGVVGDGLRAMSLSVRDCVTELGLALRAMGEEDSSAAKKAIERLFKCEHEADAQEDELCNQISIGELGAQEREKVPKGIWDMLAQSVSDLESEVRGLANSIEMMGSEGSDIMECVCGIREMERTLDRAYYEMTKTIFRADIDPKAVIMLLRIVDAIEMAADTCKACSDTVAILHYAKRV